MSAKPYPDLPRNRTVEIAPGVAMEFVLVLPGVFIMGDKNSVSRTGEKEEHEVHFSRPFYLGRHPVTQAQWVSVMDTNPAEFLGDEKRPVENVSWEEIVGEYEKGSKVEGFLDRLSFPTGYTFRLPTEAEWEYAAKGGHLAPQEVTRRTAEDLYSTYAGGECPDAASWQDTNNDYSTLRIGYRQPNCLGLYGMSGNVYEWCKDTFDDETYMKRSKKNQEIINPLLEVFSQDRVVRSGSWFSDPWSCRLTSRGHRRPTFLFYNQGFRLVFAPILK